MLANAHLQLHPPTHFIVLCLYLYMQASQCATTHQTKNKHVHMFTSICTQEYYLQVLAINACSLEFQVRPLLLEPIALAVYEFRDGQIGDMLNPIGKCAIKNLMFCL